jgi:hypothetical protein
VCLLQLKAINAKQKTCHKRAKQKHWTWRNKTVLGETAEIIHGRRGNLFTEKMNFHTQNKNWRWAGVLFFS